MHDDSLLRWPDWIAARATVRCHCSTPRADECRALWCRDCSCHSPLPEAVFGAPERMSVEIQQLRGGEWETAYFLTDVASFIGPRQLGRAILQDWAGHADTEHDASFRVLTQAGRSVAEVTTLTTATGTAAA